MPLLVKPSPKNTKSNPSPDSVWSFQGTQAEKVSKQNLSRTARFAPAATVTLEGTKEEQCCTTRRMTKHRTSPLCPQQLREGCNWYLLLFPTLGSILYHTAVCCCWLIQLPLHKSSGYGTALWSYCGCLLIGDTVTQRGKPQCLFLPQVLLVGLG